MRRRSMRWNAHHRRPLLSDNRRHPATSSRANLARTRYTLLRMPEVRCDRSAICPPRTALYPTHPAPPRRKPLGEGGKRSDRARGSRGPVDTPDAIAWCRLLHAEADGPVLLGWWRYELANSVE